VLAGGPSCEREISLISGRAVFDALTAKGLSVFMMDPLGDFMAELKCRDISVAFLALHGTFGEDGTIQRMLEEAGICYTGPGPRASELAFDKASTQRLLRDAGLTVPDFIVLEKGQKPPPVRPPFPFVVKPSKSGSSVGISIVSKEEDCERALSEAFRYSDNVLIEQYIEGRELTVGILGGEALPVGEIIAKRKFYDYEAKYKDSGTRYEFPAKLAPREAAELSEAALRVCRVLGCEIMARVDIILGTDGEPYVLEVNTIPGLTGKSLLPKAAQARGIDFPELCVKILELSLWRRDEESRVTDGETYKSKI